MAMPSANVDPSSGNFDTNVRDVVRILMAAAGFRSIRELGEATGMSKSAIYERMRAGDSGKMGFTAAELHRLAEVFGVAPQLFFDPADVLRERIRSGVVIGRYPQYDQVSTGLDVVRDVVGQLSLDEAPRYDEVSKPRLVQIAS